VFVTLCAELKNEYHLSGGTELELLLDVWNGRNLFQWPLAVDSN